jgi:hypothetical protein
MLTEQASCSIDTIVASAGHVARPEGRNFNLISLHERTLCLRRAMLQMSRSLASYFRDL